MAPSAAARSASAELRLDAIDARPLLPRHAYPTLRAPGLAHPRIHHIMPRPLGSRLSPLVAACSCAQMQSSSVLLRPGPVGVSSNSNRHFEGSHRRLKECVRYVLDHQQHLAPRHLSLQQHALRLANKSSLPRLEIALANVHKIGMMSQALTVNRAPCLHTSHS